MARFAPIAIVSGGLIGWAMSGFNFRPRGIAHGALIGFCCFLGACIGELYLHNWMDEKPGAWWRRALVYFFGGQVGWPIGLFLGIPLLYGQPITAVHMPRSVWFVVLFSGGIGTLFGVSIYSYNHLKDRLQRSLEQLKDKEIAEKELELARAFQSRLLPAPEIAAEGYHISGRNIAARYVAGDFYDVFRFADGAVGIAVADVAGKGVAASLIMASVKAVLPLIASSHDVDRALSALNEKLAGELGKREFVALALARFEPETGRITLANAGLPDPYVVSRNGDIRAIGVPGPRLPLGLKRALAYEKVAFTLNRGESLFLFSDGLPEAIHADGEQLGYERLAVIIAADGDVDKILQGVGFSADDDDQTLVRLARTA